MDARGSALTDTAVFARELSDQQAGWMEWAKKAGAMVHDTINLAQVTLKQVKFGVGPLFAAIAEQRKNPELKLHVRYRSFLFSAFNALHPTFAVQRDEQWISSSDTKHRPQRPGFQGPASPSRKVYTVYSSRDS